MLDAIVEFFGRFIANFIAEVLLVGIFYWPGWLICRLITLGQYPPPRPKSHNEYFVSGIPLVLILVVVTLYYS